MASPNFPSTGLVPNETKFTVGALTYLWDGEKWRTITAKLSADQITYDSSETVKDTLDRNSEYMALKIFQSPTDGGLTEIQTRTVDAGEVYEVRKTSDGSLATIYSDAAGTAEIVQNGTNNVSDGAGVVGFYIADTFEELKIEIGARSAKFKNNVFIQQHTREQGIGVWDTDTVYPVGGLAKGSDNRLYEAIKEQYGNDPVGDAVNWKDAISNDKIYAREFSTVALMQAFSGAVLGQKFKTYKYNADVITIWEVVSSGAGDLTDRTLSIAGGLFVKMISDIHNVLSYGAYGNDINDDKPFFDTAKIGSGNALIIPVPPIRYNLSNGIDWSGTTVTGGSKQYCKLRFSTAQTDCIISTGDTVISNLHLDGHWDGVTPAQTGDLIRVDSVSFIGEFHMSHCTLVNAKQDSLSMSNLGYSSLTDIRSQVSGRNGLHLDGSGAKTVTSLKLYGKNRFSDCPNGFGIRVAGAHNCDLSSVISEFTAGIEIAGTGNRSLCFNEVYQEFGSFPEAYTFSGDGDGLTITNNFGGGKTIPNTANFINVTMFGNSNFSSIAPIQVNDLVSAVSVQKATALGTGQFTETASVTSVLVPPGLWRVEANLQTEDAGGSSLNSLSMYITSGSSDSAYQTGTASLKELTNSVFGSPSPQTRLNISGLLSLSVATTFHMRFGHDQVAGQIAFIGKMTFEKVK